ncbi:MAG: flavin reductase family protein [Planctomycetes bacterium]|nr:flavin reductase family protein [Planctomycetota bacterium]
MHQELTLTQGAKLIAPNIYALVTCLDSNGKPNAIGVSWVTRTSIDPYLILISIAFTRYSHDAIAQSGEFVINYPTEEQAAGAWLCGVESGREQNKIEKAGLKLIDSKIIKTPTIADVTVAFECKTVSSFVTGDHTVFVGEVVAVTGDPEKSKHLFVTANASLISLDFNGNINQNIEKNR